MKDSVVGAFIAGGLLGALLMWLVAHRDEPPMAPPTAGPTTPPPSRPVELPTARAVDPEPVPRSPEPARDGAALAEAKREARANLLKGALVLEVGGRTPEQILKPILDVEPRPGTVRISRERDSRMFSAWMELHTILPEEFEEALAQCLDNETRWTQGLELDADALRDIRAYTERALRTMVAIQQRQAAYRALVADPGRLSPGERKALDEKFATVGGMDQRVYELVSAPAFRLPLLFPARK